MNKTLAAAFLLMALTTGATFAQHRGYGYPDNRDRRGPQPQYNDARDEYREELKIDRIDAIVGLSRRQEKQLHKIEDQYDRMMSTSRLTTRAYRDLQLRKRQDMLAVLTSAQRDRLFDAQQSYGRRPGGPYRRG